MGFVREGFPKQSYSENTYVEDSNKPVESSFVVQISEDAKLEEVDKDIGNDFASFMQDIKNFLQGNFLGGWAFTDEKEEPTDLEEKAIDDDAEQALVKDVLDDTTKENGEDVVDASEFVDVSVEAKLDRDEARRAGATKVTKDPHKWVMVVYKPFKLFSSQSEEVGEVKANPDFEEKSEESAQLKEKKRKCSKFNSHEGTCFLSLEDKLARGKREKGA
ncbi:hypothetical protein V6N13_125091 [Hibiscus sabdariffa]